MLTVEEQTQISAIKARLSAITPGPWKTDNPFGASIETESGDYIGSLDTFDDNDFAANAPEDIDRLLAIVERLKVELQSAHNGMTTLAEDVSAEDFETEDTETIVCPHCGHQYDDDARIMEHIPINMSYLAIECEECGKTFYAQADIVYSTVGEKTWQ
jgi:DNA-directed RNA polymerase subunit RPC12/RpoP